MDISKKLVETHSLTKEECLELFSLFNNSEVMEYLKEEAVKVRKQYYGTKVFTRGLIEFTNYCKNNCYYCGIRRDNRNVERYRLSEEEILACCANGEKLGFRTFVLQGGEDPWYTQERIADIVKKIKKAHPDCAITLSVGEKSKEIYFNDEKILLTKGEYKICEYLARHKGQVFTLEQIFIEVYGFDKDSDSSCIREHIKNIRAKLTKYIESPITTVWGIGYKWI